MSKLTAIEKKLLLVAVLVSAVQMAVNWYSTIYDSDFYVLKITTGDGFDKLNTAQAEWLRQFVGLPLGIIFKAFNATGLNPVILNYLQFFIHSIVMVFFMKKIFDILGMEEFASAVCSLVFFAANPFAEMGYGYPFFNAFRTTVSYNIIRLYPLFFYLLLQRRGLWLLGLFFYVLLFHPVHAAVMVFTDVVYTAATALRKGEKIPFPRLLVYPVVMLLYFMHYAQSPSVDIDLWTRIVKIQGEDSFFMFPWKHRRFVIFLLTLMLYGVLVASMYRKMREDEKIFFPVIGLSILMFPLLHYVSIEILRSPVLFKPLFSRASVVLLYLLYFLVCVWAYRNFYAESRRKFWWFVACIVIFSYYNILLLAYLFLSIWIVRKRAEPFRVFKMIFLLYMAAWVIVRFESSIFPPTLLKMFDPRIMLAAAAVLLVIPYVSKRLGQKAFASLCLLITAAGGVYLGSSWNQLQYVSFSKLTSYYELVGFIKKNAPGRIVLYAEDEKSNVIGSIGNYDIPTLVISQLLFQAVYANAIIPSVVKELEIVYQIDLEKDSVGRYVNLGEYMRNRLKNLTPEELVSIKKAYPLLKFLVFPASWIPDRELPAKLVFRNKDASVYEVSEAF